MQCGGFVLGAYASHPVLTPDLVFLLLWFAESARGTPACVLFRLCSVCTVCMARQFRWKSLFVFATRLLLVSQLASLLLFLQLATSLMDVVSASS